MKNFKYIFFIIILILNITKTYSNIDSLWAKCKKISDKIKKIEYVINDISYYYEKKGDYKKTIQILIGIRKYCYNEIINSNDVYYKLKLIGLYFMCVNYEIIDINKLGNINVNKYNTVFQKIKNILQLNSRYIEKKLYYEYLFYYNNLLGNINENSDTCLMYYNKSFYYANKVYKTDTNNLNSIKLLQMISNNIALIYHTYKGDYLNAIKYYFFALKYTDKYILANQKESTSFLQVKSKVLNNISLVYFSLNELKKAKYYLSQSINIKEKQGDSIGYYTSIINLSSFYYKSEDVDSSQILLSKAINYFKRINNLKMLAKCYANLSAIYEFKKEYENALSYMLKSLEIREQLKDSINLMNNYTSLSSFYLKLIEVKKENPDRALLQIKKYISKVEEISSKTKINSRNEDYYYIKSIISFFTKDFNEFLKYFALYINEIKSNFSEEKSKSFAELEKKYETEKKQLIIEKLDKEKKLKESELKRSELIRKRQRLLIISSFIIVFIISASMFFITKLYRKLKIVHSRLKESYNIIEEKNELLSQANIEITQKNEEISSINKQLIDSINYAKLIQEAVLPSRDAIKSFKREHFIYFKPKDVVSGDFYWYTEIGKVEVYTVADCTGHGVPGGFMSMLGIALLNEIVRKKEITQANQVLNELRKEIIIALKQKGEPGEQKDGMDISLLVIENDKDICQWAGANNPLYFVSEYSEIVINKTNNKNSNQYEEITLSPTLTYSNGYFLFELLPDKMPIAIYPVLNDFTNYTFKITKGYAYLFSDGFAGQFGGPDMKKYSYKKLKELLLKNAKLSLDEQIKIIENEFDNWKGANEQVDDVTIIAIKI